MFLAISKDSSVVCGKCGNKLCVKKDTRNRSYINCPTCFWRIYFKDNMRFVFFSPSVHGTIINGGNGHQVE